MSKMDGLRAMREARHEQAAARAGKPAAAPQVTRRPAPTPTAAGSTRSVADSGAPESSEARLCGHRAISGRTCTREHGHAAKSHRYA